MQDHNWTRPEKELPTDITVKTLNKQKKEKPLKAVREKNKSHLKEILS